MLKIVRELKLPFYLTGGTALSRYYYHYRYSDDLDLFVNADQNYAQYVTTLLSEIQNNKSRWGFSVNYDRLVKYADYSQIYLLKDETELRIDLVNDIAAHFGDFANDEELGLIDSWRNILSNKISAFYRFEMKDYVDVWIIAKKNHFNWQEIIHEARQKEGGIDPITIFTLFKSFPFSDLYLLKWAIPFDKAVIEHDFSIIAKDIFEGADNSLFRD